MVKVPKVGSPNHVWIANPYPWLVDTVVVGIFNRLLNLTPWYLSLFVIWHSKTLLKRLSKCNLLIKYWKNNFWNELAKHKLLLLKSFFLKSCFWQKCFSKWSVKQALNLKKILFTGLLIKYIKFADLICISLVRFHSKFMQTLSVSLRHIFTCKFLKCFVEFPCLGRDSLYDQSRVNCWHPFLALYGRQWSNWNCWHREVLKLHRVSLDGEFVAYYISNLTCDQSCLLIKFSWNFFFYIKVLLTFFTFDCNSTIY